ncbi:hypothetical protein ACHAW5_001118 [Stephanodiscus triporus]|uniref:Uncharacterized protein n=1 Tax=Stephanodiscus triporus TaxID=2934178 RepID=A0ABD3P3S7_9STRA
MSWQRHRHLTLTASKEGRTLGLLTFDLNDLLYPIVPVLRSANGVFFRAMANYGYNLEPDEIVKTTTRIRAEAGPAAGSAMSHTAVCLITIRREMERKMVEKKLRECAKNWATEVSETGSVKSAENWAKKVAVQDSVVESIYYAWEDDASGRTEFFKELGNIDGNADLQWIYRAAYGKYREIAETKTRDENEPGGCGEGPMSEVLSNVTMVALIRFGSTWDDLAYDVSGSASCGARTILLNLDNKYGQTAKA